MFFSAGVKEELAGLNLGNACCRLAELAGVAMAAGAMHLSSGGVRAEITTESPGIARRVYRIIKSLYGVKPVIEQWERHRLNRNFSYRVVVTDDGAARKMLSHIGALGYDDMSGGIRPEFVRLSCCEGSFLRGLFLGCGSMSDPGKGYHLELVLQDEQRARAAVALLAGMDIHARIARRSGRHVIYIKEAEHISGFLVLAGAHGHMLRFEGVRVEKGVRNSVNRVVNCDTANVEKSVQASTRQTENIMLLNRHGGLRNLPQGLRDAAGARLENPDASLETLAEILGDVSKSGLNNRFRRIAALADEIRSKERLVEDGHQKPENQQQ